MDVKNWFQTAFPCSLIYISEYLANCVFFCFIVFVAIKKNESEFPSIKTYLYKIHIDYIQKWLFIIVLIRIKLKTYFDLTLLAIILSRSKSTGKSKTYELFENINCLIPYWLWWRIVLLAILPHLLYLWIMLSKYNFIRWFWIKSKN